MILKIKNEKEPIKVLEAFVRRDPEWLHRSWKKQLVTLTRMRRVVGLGCSSGTWVSGVPKLKIQIMVCKKCYVWRKSLLVPKTLVSKRTFKYSFLQPRKLEKYEISVTKVVLIVITIIASIKSSYLIKSLHLLDLRVK